MIGEINPVLAKAVSISNNPGIRSAVLCEELRPLVGVLPKEKAMRASAPMVFPVNFLELPDAILPQVYPNNGIWILALRQQLNIYKRKSRRPVLRNKDRLF